MHAGHLLANASIKCVRGACIQHHPVSARRKSPCRVGYGTLGNASGWCRQLSRTCHASTDIALDIRCRCSFPLEDAHLDILPHYLANSTTLVVLRRDASTAPVAMIDLSLRSMLWAGMCLGEVLRYRSRHRSTNDTEGGLGDNTVNVSTRPRGPVARESTLGNLKSTACASWVSVLGACVRSGSIERARTFRYASSAFRSAPGHLRPAFADPRRSGCAPFSTLLNAVCIGTRRPLNRMARTPLAECWPCDTTALPKSRRARAHSIRTSPRSPASG